MGVVAEGAEGEDEVAGESTEQERNVERIMDGFGVASSVLHKEYEYFGE